MLTLPVLLLLPLLTPTLTPAGLEQCVPDRETPVIEVAAERGAPSFSQAQSTAGLTQQSAGAYRPAGVGGPAWHTNGLTQSNIRISQEVSTHTLTMPTTATTCLYIDKIRIEVALSPTVWVANEYPPGSCMYNAVKGHEMKHVAVDRAVTDRHLDKIRAALAGVTQDRAFFGPDTVAAVKADTDGLMAEIKTAMERQQQDFYNDEEKSQRAVDTMQEYRRVAALCPQQK